MAKSRNQHRDQNRTQQFDDFSPIAAPQLYERNVRQETERRSLVGEFRRKLAILIAGDTSLPAPRPMRDTTASGCADASYTSFTDRMWNISYERRVIYQDLLDMDRNGPLISTGLSIIADNTVCYEDVDVDGFQWELIKANSKALAVLNSLKQRLQLGQEVWQIVRNFTCFGEEYREMAVDADGLVQTFNSLPAWTILPRFDALGNRVPGFTQRPESMPGIRTIQLDEWQIIPFIDGPRRGWYGTGLMYSARRAFRRHEKMADGMAIARMTRAYDKLIHYVPVRQDWDEKRQQEKVWLYRTAMTKKRGLDSQGNPYMREDPFTVETDIYVPEDGTKRGRVEVLAQQNMQLMNVEDLRYHQDEILAALRVPRKYLNMQNKGQSSTSSAILAEDRQFARMLRQRQAVLRLGLITLGIRALTLQGFRADDLGVCVKMARINVVDFLEAAKVEFTLAQAAQLYSMTLLQGGLPPEILADRYMQLNDEEKEILKNFIVETEKGQEKAEKKAEAQAAARGGRTSTNSNGTSNNGTNSNAPTATQVAEVLATLGVLCQKTLEEEGSEFNIGYSERKQLALNAIDDIVSTNGYS